MDERIPPETKASAAAAVIRRWGPRCDGLTVRQKSHLVAVGESQRR
jgi:hypothetical protein